MNRNLKIVLISALAAVGFVLLWRSANHTFQEQVSEDSLSVGIGERWGGGLPAGYEKQEVESPESGYLFARLTYDEPVNELLTGWEAPDDALLSAFAELVEGHLRAAELTAAQRTQIEEARPIPTENWLGYTMTDGDARIVLLYDSGGRTMYLAEYWP